MAETSKVILKLLVDKKGERVLFAEAGKDFVDFLFHLFSLPLGSVVKLLSKNQMVGCLGKLYESIESLSDVYLQPSTTKKEVLNPVIPSTRGVPLLLPGASASSATKTQYGCQNCYNSSCRNYVADDPKATCNCGAKLSRPLTYVAAAPSADAAAKTEEGGYVKGVVTYMIMDNLQVKPMSSISSITLLNTFKVKELRDLEEKVVYLTMSEGLKLLRASLLSETVLTDVFL